MSVFWCLAFPRLGCKIERYFDSVLAKVSYTFRGFLCIVDEIFFSEQANFMKVLFEVTLWVRKCLYVSICVCV